MKKYLLLGVMVGLMCERLVSQEVDTLRLEDVSVQGSVKILLKDD